MTKKEAALKSVGAWIIQEPIMAEKTLVADVFEIGFLHGAEWAEARTIAWLRDCGHETPPNVRFATQDIVEWIEKKIKETDV